MSFEDTIQKIQKNIAPALLNFAEIVSQYTIPAKQFQQHIEKLRPVLANIASISSIYQAAEKMAENQFVVTNRLPKALVDQAQTEDIDILMSEYLTSDELVQDTITLCGLSENRVFTQAVNALSDSSNDLAILGLTAVLDRMLSEHSGQVKNVRIRSRCEAITKKVEEKGALFLDEMEGRDFLLFLTYPRALELFGADSNFTGEEPALLNRHWIMHGRSKRVYTKLDSVKVLNMIYGTIRMGQLGKEDLCK